MKNSLKEIPVEAQRSVKQHYPEVWVIDSHAKLYVKQHKCEPLVHMEQVSNLQVL